MRSVDITEAWQETGSDFITVRVYANLLDYNVDETTGQVVEGSKTEPVKFEEYWTFTRPVGSNPWQLSAIQQAPVNDGFRFPVFVLTCKGAARGSPLFLCARERGLVAADFSLRLPRPDACATV